MRCALLVVLSVGCGRVGFDVHGDAGRDDLVLGAIAISNVTVTSFDVEIAFTGDRNGNASVALQRCNDTDSIGCDPASGAPLAMTRGAGTFTTSVAVAMAEDPGDTLSLAVVASDPDGSSAPVVAVVT